MKIVRILIVCMFVLILASTATALTCDEQIDALINKSCIMVGKPTLKIQSMANEPILEIQAANEILCAITSETMLDTIATKVSQSFQNEEVMNAQPEEVAARFRKYGFNETGRAITYQAQTLVKTTKEGVQYISIPSGQTFLTVASSIREDRTAVELINFDHRNGELKHDHDGWAFVDDLSNPVELIKINITEMKKV